MSINTVWRYKAAAFGMLGLVLIQDGQTSKQQLTNNYNGAPRVSPVEMALSQLGVRLLTDQAILTTESFASNPDHKSEVDRAKSECQEGWEILQQLFIASHEPRRSMAQSFLNSLKGGPCVAPTPI
jgi:hypothetical protein